ncbi:MAG: hypothetical protein H7X94_03185 [Vallitaleaceae bacterium]|nr:hypothetical protein [Vallitaleaceae bacterium]
MKKLMTFLTALTLVFVFSTSLVVQAQESTTPKVGTVMKNVKAEKEAKAPKVDPQVKFNEFLTNLEQKQDVNYDEHYSKWTENQVARQTRNEAYLEVIATYAPDLATVYQAAFTQHDALHIELFDERTAIRKAFNDEMISGLKELQTELFAQASSGEITWKEARDGLKTYLVSRKDELKASMDTYRSAIATREAQWNASAVEVKALHVELQAAIKSEDAETAKEIITELYEYFQEHIAFDAFKLETMENAF